MICRRSFVSLILGHCLFWAWLGFSVAGEPIDINSASPDQLKSLPGMSEGYIMMIIGARPFQSKEDLVEQKLLPQETYDQIKNQIFVKGGSLRPTPPSTSSMPQPNAMSGPEQDEKRDGAGMVSPTDSSSARVCIKEERTKERMCGELLR